MHVCTVRNNPSKLQENSWQLYFQAFDRQNERTLPFSNVGSLFLHLNEVAGPLAGVGVGAGAGFMTKNKNQVPRSHINCESVRCNNRKKNIKRRKMKRKVNKKCNKTNTTKDLETGQS